jgi:hypothetical protein
MVKLPLGQELQISEKRYHVVGAVQYRQGFFTWTEYELEPYSESGFRGSNAWLSVERDGADAAGDACLFSLHESIPFLQVRPEGQNSVEYSGTFYTLIERGAANVLNYRGNGDYDFNESFTFIEYRSEAGEILTREFWSDEQEASLGRELAASDVRLLGSRGRVHVSNDARMTRWIVRVCMLLVLIGFFFSFSSFSFNTTPRIARQLAQNSSFTHVTSVTLEGSTKGQVYSTSLSPDEACRVLIAMDPERVRYVTTALPESADIIEANGNAQSERGQSERLLSERLLQTSRETVMIYESEHGATYVQVSDDGVSEARYSVYRPRRYAWPLRLYLNSRRWYSRSNRLPDARSTYNIDADGYAPVVANARQASVRARRSSGGGLGFGK